MKKLISIESHRLLEGDASWKIVYEWEDIISKKCNIPIVSTKPKIKRFIYGLLNRLSFYGLTNFFSSSCKLRLYYLSVCNTKPDSFLTKSVIPVIIDFWLKDNELEAFFQKFKNVPLILCTNREVYEKLKANNSPIPVEHWGLSFPDIYALERDENYPKEYEFCIFGRPNPFFIRLLDKYCETHSDFTYILNNGNINNRQYINNRGEYITSDNGRQSYIDMIRKTKISCYSTPGIDESKHGANGYNQVTPRVFEMLCNGCFVIGHYPQNADTVWYKLNTIVPNVDTYEEFEKILDNMRVSELDIKNVKKFMHNHYTSYRSIELKKILEEYGISL